MTAEKFREWNFRGAIKVRYIDGTGHAKMWEKNQQQLLDEIKGIVEFYSAQEIKLTNRQLYYQLVKAGAIPNAKKIYDRICEFLTDARYAGLIDWDALEDTTRVPKKHPEWDSVRDIVESAINQYRLPRWQDQGHYVELYCEKDALKSIFDPIADKYHIHGGYNRGYSGAAAMYVMAQRIKEKILEGRHAVVLYLGDHDPSGLDMVRDIKERLTEFIATGDNPVEPDFEVVPLALKMEQIKEYNSPPNPAKETDSRAKKYIAEFGSVSWELDALEPKVLRGIAEDGILEYLNMDRYSKWVNLEKEQKKALEIFAKELAENENEGTKT